MPALSQTLTFIINNARTTVLNYPNPETEALEYTSIPVKGEGYFGGTDGVHTLQTNISDFIGIIEMQGTIASAPTELDWFPIKLGTNVLTLDTTGAIVDSDIDSAEYTQATTEIKTYKIIGNFIWIRANVSEWTEGTVNNIRINH